MTFSSQDQVCGLGPFASSCVLNVRAPLLLLTVVLRWGKRKQCFILPVRSVKPYLLFTWS